MKLYYIRAEAHTGDADGPANMDLFVHADAPSNAVKLWGQHYAEWGQPDDDKVLVYDVSQLAICESVMDWDHIPCTQHKAPKL